MYCIVFLPKFEKYVKEQQLSLIEYYYSDDEGNQEINKILQSDYQFPICKIEGSKLGNTNTDHTDHNVGSSTSSVGTYFGF